MNERQRWSRHLINEFDCTTNIFQLLKTMYSPHYEQSSTEEKWYKHITNYVATIHWEKSSTQLAHLQAISIVKLLMINTCLNPTMRDIFSSTLEHDSFGGNVKKKRARRHMCFIDGNTKRYSKWLNFPAQMGKYADHNELIKIVAELRLEKGKEKKKLKEKKGYQ